MSQSLLLFADRLPPLTGGMEMHAKFFIDHFTEHCRFPLAAIVSRNSENRDILIFKNSTQIIELDALKHQFRPNHIFFNSGRWIEEMAFIRKVFPEAKFIYRTGGNEILKAPLIRHQISDHLLRQKFWAETLNQNIDLMITNSAYTESRLREIGLTCPFVRSVGGANADVLRSSKKTLQGEFITIFCAARFVPYKNHQLLLSVVRELNIRGHNIKLRLAGEGPLLSQIQQYARALGIYSIVHFLGNLDNEKVCQEIAQANIYMQFSQDYLTHVPGGSYIHSECMGRSIIEALTAGTYVIAGRSGSLEEIVTPPRGLLVNIDHPAKITDQIEGVLRSLPDPLPFCEDYCWKKVFERYEEIYQHLFNGSGTYS